MTPRLRFTLSFLVAMGWAVPLLWTLFNMGNLKEAGLSGSAMLGVALPLLMMSITGFYLLDNLRGDRRRAVRKSTPADEGGAAGAECC